MRWYKKSWQDKRPGWTRRVRWYQGDDDIRLLFDTPEGKISVTYTVQELAEVDYKRFCDGSLMFWELLEKRG